jgi:hypothetical protein
MHSIFGLPIPFLLIDDEYNCVILLGQHLSSAFYSPFHKKWTFFLSNLAPLIWAFLRAFVDN